MPPPHLLSLFYFVITEDAGAILDFREKQHEMRRPDIKFSVEFVLPSRIGESLETFTPQHQLYNLVTVSSSHKRNLCPVETFGPQSIF